jgi:hypothetical protein
VKRRIAHGGRLGADVPSLFCVAPESLFRETADAAVTFVEPGPDLALRGTVSVGTILKVDFINLFIKLKGF